MSIQSKDIVLAFKKQPLLFVCVVLSIVLSLAYYFRKDMISEAETTLSAQSQALGKLKANVANAAQLEAQLKTLKDTNLILRQAALKEGLLAENQQVFLRLESETGVKLDFRPLSVPPPGKNNPNFYVPMGFSLNISGEYRKLVLFLKRLDRAATLNRIVSASASDSTGGTYSMNVTIELLGIRQ